MYNTPETPSSDAVEAAWEAYQNTPIDLCGDTDDEYKKCVANAVAAALASLPTAGLKAENEALRAERDALLREPLNMAEMDSIDDDNGTPERMLAYYWYKECMKARTALKAGSDQ